LRRVTTAPSDLLRCLPPVFGDSTVSVSRARLTSASARKALTEGSAEADIDISVFGWWPKIFGIIGLVLGLVKTLKESVSVDNLKLSLSQCGTFW
jgi:hypothetical protein